MLISSTKIVWVVLMFSNTFQLSLFYVVYSNTTVICVHNTGVLVTECLTYQLSTFLQSWLFCIHRKRNMVYGCSILSAYCLFTSYYASMKKYNSSKTAESFNNVVRSRVSAILILEVFWNVMNKQIASNRDLKMVAQKSQLSDKTKNVIDYQEKSIVISSSSKQRADTGIKHKDLHTKLTKPTSRCRVT